MKKFNMRPNNTNGLLITFCGLDGCGKTTIINRLTKDLETEYKVLLTKQPTDFVRQSAIFRTFMDSPDNSAYDYRSLSLLAASDRLQHVSKVIEPALQANHIVLSDRYYYSCLANLIARGYSNDQWIYEISQSVIQPDIAFFFDVPVELAVARVRNRPAERNRYIDMDLQFKLRDAYLDICKANNSTLVHTAGDVEDSYKKVKETVWRKIGLEN